MKRFIPLIVVLLLTLVLVFVFDDFVRFVIVEPLLIVFWLGGIFLQSLPHFVVWVAFIIVTLIILMRSLQINVSWPNRGPKSKDDLPRGAVASWQNQLERADRQLYFRWQLSRSLAKLARETLTRVDVLDPNETQPSQAIMDTLPREIAAYFQTPAPRKPAAKTRWYHRQSEPKAPALEMDPEVVVEFLEKEAGWE